RINGERGTGNGEIKCTASPFNNYYFSLRAFFSHSLFLLTITVCCYFFTSGKPIPQVVLYCLPHAHLRLGMSIIILFFPLTHQLSGLFESCLKAFGVGHCFAE